MVPQAVLELENLSVAAGGRRLLQGVDLSLAAGELVALRGPSGCGKTTLLRAVAGLDDPADGAVRISGSCPEDLRWPCWRRRAVLVDQRPVLLPGAARGSLARPFAYRTADGPFDERRARELLARLGLPAAVLDQEARSLSVGEQQRLCLARALLVEPEVLLLDEPTSALDEESTARVEDLVSGEADGRGLAALIVTHGSAQAARWCRRTVDLAAFATGAAWPDGEEDAP